MKLKNTLALSLAAVMAAATPAGSPSGLTLAEKSSASRPNSAR